MSAAQEGRVPVHLTSEKNYLETISLLGVFAKGTRSVLIETAPPPPAGGSATTEQTSPTTYLGGILRQFCFTITPFRAITISDVASTFSSSSSFRIHTHIDFPALSQPIPSPPYPNLSTLTPRFTFATLLAYSLNLLALPTLQVYVFVVAVVDDGGGGYGGGYGSWGGLNGTVSVTDIGKSNYILSLHQFVAQTKEPDGSTDGADKYPANAHRLFVTDSDFEPSSSPGSPMGGRLCGIVSVVDIPSLRTYRQHLKRRPHTTHATSASSQSSARGIV
ncbi:hypothetical protein M405DRAFT_935755 [Rhizopogon salebrosus TDB-379]|nr:hypothetical protein M405DRAFT_935755 [Rhizopogon salebrosus TDB-379]